MHKNRTLWLLVSILIIASFLRLYHITTTPPGLYPDEAMDGTNAQEALATGHFQPFYPENNGREGLFMNVQAIFLKFIGQNEPWVLRLPSALFGVLTVLGIYFLATELFGMEIGLLAAFLLATSFWHIMFSRIGFRAIMSPFFITWALYLLLRGYRAIREKMPFWKATSFHIVGGAVFGLGFYSYIAYRVTPALILLVMLFYFRTSVKEKWRKIFLHTSAHFILFSILVAIPLAVYFVSTPGSFFGRTTQVSVFSSGAPLHDLALNTIKTLGMFNVVGDWNQRHNESGRPELFWPVGILFVIGFVMGIRNIWKDRKNLVRLRGNIESGEFSFLMVFALFALALLPVVISNEGIPHALRSILLVPPAIILAAAGGMYTYRFLKKFIRASRIKPFAAIFLVLLAIEAYSAYFLVWAKDPKTPGAFAANYVTLGRELNALPNDTPKYVVVDAGGVLVRGIPMPSQTVMFITDTFTPEKQAAKNIHYVLPENENAIPADAFVFHIK
jgi:4-amino-4-deoxy-L-arabinose transferase-like glycosyltransferase